MPISELHCVAYKTCKTYHFKYLPPLEETPRSFGPVHALSSALASNTPNTLSLTMSFPEKGKQKVTSPDIQSPTPHRPQSLLQHLSSGLSSIIPRLPSRKSTPRHSSQQHHAHHTTSEGIITSGPQLSHSQQAPISRIGIPILSEPDSPYTDDPRGPYSSPSTEHTRCGLCGLRHASPQTSNTPPSTRPWSQGRSKGLLSHVAFNLGRSRNGSRESHSVQSDLTRLIQGLSPEECPRLVPAAIAVTRVGNPPRRASLPVSRLPVARLLRLHGLQPAQERPVTVGATDFRTDSSNDEDVEGTAEVPKLHYMRGLPNAKDYPYVYKREVEKHLDALHSGAASPLVQVEARPSLADTSTGVTDYSETVFYGDAVGFPSSRRSKHSCTPHTSQPPSPTALDRQLQSSQVYQRHSPPSQSRPRPRNALPQIPGSDSTFSSVDSTGTPKVGGKRLELKGGDAQSAESKLRGGNGGKRTCNLSCCCSKVKTRLLTRGSCQAYSHDMEGNTNGKLARTVDSVCVSRSDPPTISQPLPSIPTCFLRGGAGSPPTTSLQATCRIPPTLYMLAGGTGKRPVTVGSCKKQRPEKRMGGLFGMAVFGGKAGMGYGKEDGDVHVHVGREQNTAVEGGSKSGENRASSSKSTSISRPSSAGEGSARGGQAPLADDGGAGAPAA